MGCGNSSQAVGASSPAPTLLTASQARPKGAGDNSLKFVPGQAAIIRNCPNAHLNGQQVICEEYNDGLGEWLVKGDRFPLSVGMSLGEQFLEPAGAPAQTQSSCTPQQACKLRTMLEQSNESIVNERVLNGSNGNIGEFVQNVCAQADGIIQQGTGLGASGECPFASAYEVHLFYQFCLNVCVAWSEHKMGNDEKTDKDFYSQMSSLCEILYFLDTSAVPLPEEIDQNIKRMQQGLFPHYVDAQIPNGKEALETCIAIGSKWRLEETEAFEKTLAALGR